jgi:hypothetical protein
MMTLGQGVNSEVTWQDAGMHRMTDSDGAATRTVGRGSGSVVTRRRPRRSREDLRSLLLEAAQAILFEEGLGVGTDALNFKRVFDRVEKDTGIRLTNASVIRRIWDSQADYHTDVLIDIAADEGTQEMAQTVEALAPVLGSLDVSTPGRRDTALREVCRIGGAANVQALRESNNWSLWIGIWALATAGDATEQKSRIQMALLEGYESVTETYEEIYFQLAALLGLRLREPLTIRQFTVAAGALAEGCTLRNRVDVDMEGIVLPTGPQGEDQEWTLFGLGLEALARRFFEPDPDWAPGVG